MSDTPALPFPGVEDLAKRIRDVKDFPKEGIIFKDITPLLLDPASLALAVEFLAQPYRGKKIDVVAGAESRGFIFGTAVAQSLSAGFVPIRKTGKLPAETETATYDLEYGTDALQIHVDAIQKGDRVVMVDDLLATGGTMEACCTLVERLGGEIVGISFLIELAFLKGREKLGNRPVHAILQFDSE